MAAATQLNPEENREDLPTFICSSVRKALFYMLQWHVGSDRDQQRKNIRNKLNWHIFVLQKKSGVKHLYHGVVGVFNPILIDFTMKIMENVIVISHRKGSSSSPNVI